MKYETKFVGWSDTDGLTQKVNAAEKEGWEFVSFHMGRLRRAARAVTDGRTVPGTSTKSGGSMPLASEGREQTVDVREEDPPSLSKREIATYWLP